MFYVLCQDLTPRNILTPGDKERGTRVARRLRSRMVEINGQSRVGLRRLGGISSLGMVGKVGFGDWRFIWRLRGLVGGRNFPTLHG